MSVESLKFFTPKPVSILCSSEVSEEGDMPAKAIATLVIETGLVNPPTLPKE